MRLVKLLYIGVVYLGALGDLKGQGQVGGVPRLSMGLKRWKSCVLSKAYKCCRGNRNMLGSVSVSLMVDEQAPSRHYSTGLPMPYADV
jgi:hypothetical protein